MNTFLISPLRSDSSKLDENIENIIEANKRFKLRNSNSWLISSSESLKDICEKLGIKKQDDETGTPALVTRVSSYGGFGNSDMWDWLDSNV